MKLKKFKASGFRCLKDIDWITIKDLLIFTGQNDGGKTSALDALEIFLNTKFNADQTDFTCFDNGAVFNEISFEGVFELSSDEQNEIEWNSPEIHIKKLQKKDEQAKYFVKTKIHPDPRLHCSLESMPMNDMKDIVAENHLSVTDKRRREEFVKVIKNWLSTQKLVDGFLKIDYKILEKLPTILLFKSAEALNPEDQINQTLRNSFVDKIRDEKYSGKISKIQHQIEKEMINDLKDFEVIVKTYCSDVENVEIAPTFDFTNGFKTSKLRLKKEDSAPINLEKEGEGRKRRITLAVYEWRKNLLAQPKNSGDNHQVIIAFDEPDTHLDYDYQRKILDMIRRISVAPQNSVIVCTHSLNLIDRIPITDVVHFKKDSDLTKVATLKTEDPELIDMFLYEISDCMGLKNSILLNERCFLIVEGDTEFNSLPIIYKKLRGFSLQAAGIRLINGKSCGGVRSLAKFLNDNKRNVIFLLDSDTREASQVFTRANLAADGFDIINQVFFIGIQEYEDAFSDDVYLRTANRYWQKHDGTPWSRIDFNTLRSAANYCDDLFRLLRSNAHQNLTKPDVGKAVAKEIAVTEIPTELITCFEGAERLAL